MPGKEKTKSKSLSARDFYHVLKRQENYDKLTILF